MKIISIAKDNFTQDDQPNPVFGVGGGVVRSGNQHMISSRGILTTKRGVNAATLIPWDEIEMLVAKHEPLLATPKTT